MNYLLELKTNLLEHVFKSSFIKHISQISKLLISSVLEFDD